MKKLCKSTIRKKQVLGIFILLTMGLMTCTNGVTAQKKCSTSNKKPAENSLSKKISVYSANGKLEELKAIIEKDHSLANFLFGNDESILTQASYNGHFEIVKYIISKGADIEHKNKWNSNSLMNASMQGHTKIVKSLIDKGAKVNEKGGDDNTALHFALMHNQPETAKLLLKNEAKVGVVNSRGQTPILMASWYGNPDVMKVLVELGANVNFTSSNGNTVLHNLCSNGNLESITYLVKKGADVNKGDENGDLPIHIAVKNRNSKVVKLLAKLTGNINLKEKRFGNTVLHIAAINGDIESTDYLLDARANPKLINKIGLSPAECAAKYGFVKLTSVYYSKQLVKKDVLKKAKLARNLAGVKVNTNELKICYTGHSGWVLLFEDKVLIIDYWSQGEKIKEESLSNGFINTNEFKNKKVYVFATHDHGDHYDTTILAWQKDIKNIQYIYGFKPEDSWIHKDKGYHGPSFTYIEDNKSRTIDDIKITTIKSDDTGQGFLIELNGMKVFHPGDHALFNEETKAIYKKEIDFIAEKTKSVDIAFLPVTGCPSRWQKEKIVEGFFYVVDKLNPQKVFPMHAFGREHLLREFAEIGKKKNYSNQIICVENKGDHFTYNKSETASK